MDHFYRCIISITAQDVIDELQRYHNLRVKYKVNISICRTKSYQRTYLEEIWYIFDEFISVVSRIEVCLSEIPLTPNNIDEYLKFPQRQFCKEVLFVQYNKNKNVSLLSDPTPIKSLSDGKIPH